MSITLQLPAVLAKLADGRRTIEAEGTTLGDVVADVATRFPGLAPRLRDEAGKPYPFVTFYVNDDDARLQGGFAASVRRRRGHHRAGDRGRLSHDHTCSGRAAPLQPPSHPP